MTPKILFVGTYLSSSSGSKGPSESISEELKKNESYIIQIVSTKKTPLLRFLDTCFLILNRRFDVAFVDIYSSRTINLTYWYCLLLRMKKTPYICVLHGGALIDNYPKIKKVLTPIISNSSYNITPSLYLKAFFIQKDFNINYIPNPVNKNLFPYQSRREMSNNQIKLLWVRAFSEIYQPKIAIRALLYLHQKGIDASLTMIGPDKGMLQVCTQFAQKNNLLPFIKFVGHIPNNELYQYYHTHHIFLNTTRYESFGMAVAESASCGTPIVSNSVGEIAFAWTDNEDIIFANNDNFSAKVFSLINDSEKYLKLSINGFKHAQKFYSENILHQWVDIIERMNIKKDQN
jgi:glycosyltransferase involved in cell wall biosynthesis